MMWGYGELGGMTWLAMSLSMIVFWALVAWAIVAVVRRLSGPVRPSAWETLARRFAQGELDEEEFRRRLSVLEHPATGRRAA